MLLAKIKKLVSVSFLLVIVAITPIAKAQMYGMDGMMGMQGMGGMYYGMSPGMMGMGGMYGMSMPGMYNMDMYSMGGMAGMYGNTGMLYGFIAGNVLGTKGWFERRSNGQLVLYPVGVSNNFSPPGGMGMSTMFSMESGKNKLETESLGQISQGWYWIAPNGHLVLSPVSGLFGRTGTKGTENSDDAVENQDDEETAQDETVTTDSPETSEMTGM